MSTKAFVLLSGGIDSSTCLALAVKEVGAENVTAISMLYGQRHHREIEAADRVAKHYDVQHRVARMAEQPPSMLTDEKQEIPATTYDQIKGQSPMYVPFRNGQMLSHITALAIGSVGRLEPHEGIYIYFGAHSEDAHRWAYADCTPEFIGAMANAIYVGTYYKARLRTPLEWLTKAQIIQLGTQMGVPWELTWSCYAGGPKHCGVCATCRARHDGFVAAGIIDPTEYAVDYTLAESS